MDSLNMIFGKLYKHFKQETLKALCVKAERLYHVLSKQCPLQGRFDATRCQPNAGILR